MNTTTKTLIAVPVVAGLLAVGAVAVVGGNDSPADSTPVEQTMPEGVLEDPVGGPDGQGPTDGPAPDDQGAQEGGLTDEQFDDLIESGELEAVPAP